ncbi:MAG: group II intron reverse transcriptase/maturase [Akkermansia sp.]|nr:group II intron reverse transcriptase/maturase [Akkermansia sp.]
MNVERQNQDTLYQLEFNFDTPAGEVRLNGSDRGGIPRKVPLQEQQAFAAWKEELNWEERILENIAHRYNLEHACQRVKSNKGAPGIDGMTVEELERWLNTHMAELREHLLNGSYQPQEVKGVSIPKPNGGRRQLGIPTAIDRLVQQAFVQVLTPILDPQMSESSYGFRPNRSAHQALKAGSAYVEQGYKVAVDLDLEKFFDKVNHDILMSKLARRIKDKRVLYYIRQMLKAGMMDNEGIKQKREQGTPQGGPLSPLLANVLLDDLDRELEKRGLHFCRYADDCIIFVRTMEAGERVLVSISRYIEEELKLKVNQQKSKVDKVWNCVYLGYIIGVEGKLRIAPASVKKLKAKIRIITRRTRPTPLREVISELIPVIRGWTNYFKLAAINKLCQELDEWTRRRLRCLRLKQCKHPKGIRRFLENLGAKRKLWSGIVAMGTRWWRIARSQPANIIMNNAWLRAEGDISFYQLLKH